MSEMLFVGGRQVGKTSPLRSVYRGGHYTGPKAASEWTPRGDCFYAVAERAGAYQHYLKWYESREEARKAGETRELVCLRFEPVEGQREQTWLWVSFDLCNGHVGGGRYIWAFHRRDLCRDQARRQNQKPRMAPLSPVYKVFVDWTTEAREKDLLFGDMYRAAKALLGEIDQGVHTAVPSAALDSLRNCVKAYEKE